MVLPAGGTKRPRLGKRAETPPPRSLLQGGGPGSSHPGRRPNSCVSGQIPNTLPRREHTQARPLPVVAEILQQFRNRLERDPVAELALESEKTPTLPRVDSTT